MSNDNTMVLIAVGALAFVMLSKKTVAPKAGTMTPASAPIVNKNVNSDMWTRLIGGAWTSLTNAQNPDGTAAFLMKNSFGQTVTSDGVPVSSGDNIGDWLATNTGLDGNFTDAPFSDTANNFVDKSFPLTESLSGTWG